MCVTERCTYSAAKPTDNDVIKPVIVKNPLEKSETCSRLRFPSFSRKKSLEDHNSGNDKSDNRETTPEQAPKFDQIQQDLANVTIVKREVWVTSQRTGLKTALESFGKQRYKINVRKTLCGLLEVLETLKK